MRDTHECKSCRRFQTLGGCKLKDPRTITKALSSATTSFFQWETMHLVAINQVAHEVSSEGCFALFRVTRMSPRTGNLIAT